MTVTVGLESYQVEAAHGAFDWERETPQPFVVSLWARLETLPKKGELATTLDYSELQRWVDTAFLKMPAAHLMEQLATRIIEMAEANGMVAGLRVRIEKPQAPLPHPGGLAVVEREWTRNQ